MHQRSGHYFQLRHNRNGTHDSICCTCFGTVSTTRNEFELARHELAHICDPVQLYQASQFAPQAMHNLGAIKRERELATPAAA